MRRGAAGRGRRRSAPGPSPPPPRRGAPEKGLGGEHVEGRQAVAELLAAGRRPVVDVWLDDSTDPAPILDRIEELAATRRVPVRRVGRARLAAEARTDACQGVLAHARPLPEADFDELCRSPGRRRGAAAAGAGAEEPPFLLALDGVTDPQNLGALLRTAEAAGVTGVVLPRHRAVHITPAVTKAAAGAVEHVPIAVVGGLPASLSRATELGMWVVGLDPSGPDSLFDLAVADAGVVLVLGAEGRGLSRLVRQRCDTLVAIPLRGALPSLNVAAAGALALYEVARRRAGWGLDR
ncbi:MAG TPA: 23S rRNA (guanosine(2251)-2'-O)-methyltransferase RlmB [Acidimicrobiales bacterium]|nr:23S rRNA (guanosine(2251)-2'-O)-methyltransferase RlmB [Acidimicrobiales bacterium]